MNQELLGGPSTLPWAVEIESANRPDGYKQFATFEPTFFYEAAWDLLLAGFLIWLGRRHEIQPPGLFALYITGYCLFRIFEELTRVDPSHYIFGLRLNFFVASIGLVAGAVWFAWTQGWWGRRRTAAATG
jgi:prolipoprotein diacylglyceryltransferase